MSKSISGYGEEFEAQCSRYCIKKLGLGEPNMGFERDVAVNGEYTLVLQNVAGVFALASHNVRVTDWAATFGEKFSTYSEQAYRNQQLKTNQNFIDKVLHLYEAAESVSMMDVLRYAPRVAVAGGPASNDELEYAAISYGREKGWNDHQQGMRPRERAMG